MDRYCKSCYSSNIRHFFKNIQWEAIIRDKFLIIIKINVIHSTCYQSFLFMTLNAFKQLEKLYGFIRSAPSFFMLLQNNCINNGATNG